MKKNFSRRSFLQRSAAAASSAFAFSVIPSHVLGAAGSPAANDKPNIAVIGIGGRGRSCINMIEKDVHFTAFCDVDDHRAAETMELYPDVKFYHDYRRMLDKEEKNIDGVLIATPDHMHAFCALKAIRMNKAVYCEKPLTHNIREVRLLREEAKKYGVATQMGNQGHSAEGARITNEWIWDGAIGQVREVYTWSDRPIWPQGREIEPGEPVPAHLNWDLWLGCAPERPYNSGYLPGTWRARRAFGTGALGDMACHIVDHPVWALGLDAPETIEGYSNGLTDDSYPHASMVKYTFGARGDMPPVDLYWYDGGMKPFTPPEMEPGRKLPDNGVLFVGDKGKMYCGSHGGMPRLIPETAMRAYKLPEKTMPRIKDSNHGMDWIRAMKGEVREACSNFEVSAKLTEIVLLGTIAQLVPGLLEYNSRTGRFSNSEDANTLVGREYRPGWSLDKA